MSSDMRSAAFEEGSQGPVAQLRRAYFAQAGDTAMRYGVVFDRLIEHLERARADQAQTVVRAMRYVDDLVHAVACVDGMDLAWRDLTEQHERALIRACRQWHDATDAIVFVRRLLVALRHEDERITSLRRFDGTCSMRRWLGDRLIGALNRSGARLPRDPAPAPEPWTPTVGRHVRA